MPEQFKTNILSFLQSLKFQKWRRYGIFKLLMQFPKKKSNISATVRVTKILQETKKAQNYFLHPGSKAVEDK